jgi:hypothetical protein
MRRHTSLINPTCSGLGSSDEHLETLARVLSVGASDELDSGARDLDGESFGQWPKKISQRALLDHRGRESVAALYK